jgi:hypothetical protein
MKIKWLLTVAFYSVAVTAFSQIINGSFENDFAGWDTTPGCFIIGHPDTEPIGTHGQVCADLGGGDTSGAALSQTFNCEPNTDYELTFQSVCNAGDDLSKVTKWQVAILNGDKLLALKKNSQKNVGQPAGNFGFVARSVKFHTGSTTSTATISFIDTTPNGGFQVDMGLDAVRVNPIRRGANLLVNSSFEREFAGWDTTPGCYIIGHPGTEPIGTEGQVCADLGGGDITDAVLSQTFNCLQPGKYQLDYDSVCNAGSNLSAVAVWEVIIAADGQEIARQTVSQKNVGQPHRRFGFRHRDLKFSVPANVQNVTVSFADVTPNGGVGIDAAFDQVKVVLVSPHR